MSALDLVLLAIIAFCGVLGFYWGFIRQSLSVLGLLAGVALAGRYGGRVADWLSSYIANPALVQLLGFLFVLLAVSAAASLLATLIRRFVGLLFLGWLDHFIGGALGLVQGALVCAVILIIVGILPNVTLGETFAASQLAPALIRVGGTLLLPFLPPMVRMPAEQLMGGL